MVAKYLAAVEDQLEGGSPPLLASLQVGQVIVARRGRGWFRGKVVAVDKNCPYKPAVSGTGTGYNSTSSTEN